MLNACRTQHRGSGLKWHEGMTCTQGEGTSTAQNRIPARIEINRPSHWITAVQPCQHSTGSAAQDGGNGCCERRKVIHRVVRTVATPASPDSAEIEAKLFRALARGPDHSSGQQLNRTSATRAAGQGPGHRAPRPRGANGSTDHRDQRAWHVHINEAYWMTPALVVKSTSFIGSICAFKKEAFERRDNSGQV